MIPRICLQKDIRSSIAKPCSVTELVAAMRDPKVQEICDTIKTLQNGEEYDKDLIQAYKRQLPAITPHACEFKSGKRKSENATASGLVMLDVDHVENPRQWVDDFSNDLNMSLPLEPNTTAKCAGDWMKEQKIYMIAITPSGHGLRVIGERREGETLADGMARLASLLGISEYDQCTKDLARLSYLMPWSYVLYFDGDGFVWENEDEGGYWLRKEYQLQLDTALEQLTTPAAAAEEALLKEKVDKTREYPLEYDGLPYKNIARELVALHGGEPKQGERNNMYFTLANDMRYLCDFDPEFMLRVMPEFGLSRQERSQVVRSAISRPRRNALPDLVQRALINVKAELGRLDNTLDMSQFKADDLQMPRLPRLLQVLCRNLPESYRAAMVIASLPVLGALATRVRFKYLDGQVHSFSFLCCIAAPAATGKSFIRQPIDLLLTPINEQDEIERKKDQEYKEKLRACRNKKEQPEDPHACPRNNGINVSVAALLKLMTYSGGKHLIAIGEEIDTLAKSERAGVWSQKSDIYRLAFDNSNYGQQYISENSFSANVQVYYNLLITGTPGGMYRFFRDVENGLVTRVAFATLPDMFATSIPKFEPYTEAERDYLVGEARRLDLEGGEIECQKVSDALARWQEEKRSLAEQTDSRAVDTIRRRAGVIGFRAGMLCYLLNERKSPKVAADFGEWVAEYVFRQQMTLFGEQFEQSARETAEKTDTSKGRVRNLLKDLPQKFTNADLIGLRRKNGQSTDIRMVLYRWQKAGYIRKEGDKEWVKIVNA